MVGDGASYGMFWGLLFGMLFFVPVFGMAVGAGLGALMGKVEKSGIDQEFQRRVRDLLQPGTSALFLVVEQVTSGQGGRGTEQVRRHGAQVVAVKRGRGGAAGGASRGCRSPIGIGTRAEKGTTMFG